MNDDTPLTGYVSPGDAGDILIELDSELMWLPGDKVKEIEEFADKIRNKIYLKGLHRLVKEKREKKDER